MMKFTQPLMHNGEPNPGRWWSDDHQYAIAKYTFYPNSIGQYEKCDPWFAAYHYPAGNRITDKYAKLSFVDAKTAAELHRSKGSAQYVY